MPGKLGPVSQREFLRRMNVLGFQGPFAGGKHPFVIRGEFRLAVPNPHGKDIGTGLLARILREAGVSRSEWERAGRS